uniref:Uncharacterized protein n=1 Tax=Prevotella sp. GTC17262 TaxID=3236797 RepID=A0AB33JTP6_9BACT
MKEFKDYKVPSTNEMMSNAENIKISEETKNLIKCRALLSGLYEYVVNSYAIVFPDTIDIKDETLDKFKDAHNRLDYELLNLIRDVVEERTLDSKYKEL